jgi:hypothetical protein
MDRNAILSGYVTSFSSYSSSDARPTVEKVLKFSGNNFDIRKRADIKREVVVFKLLNGTTDYRLNDEKPNELNQRFQALVYIEQPDSHSLKDTIYDRALEISDQLFDWATETTASDVNSDLWTLTVIGVDGIEERDGYLSTVVNFESIIQIS